MTCGDRQNARFAGISCRRELGAGVIRVGATDALARARQLNRDAFMPDEHTTSTVDLHAHRAASDLDELDLDEPDTAAG